MKGLRTKVTIFGSILGASLIALGVTTRSNTSLQERLTKRDLEYQESLHKYRAYTDSTDKLIAQYNTLIEALSERNRELNEDQRILIIDLTEQRNENHERITNVKHWSDDKRDSFWAGESLIQDSLITISH